MTDLPWGSARGPGCEDAPKRDAEGRRACDTLGLGSVRERCQELGGGVCQIQKGAPHQERAEKSRLMALEVGKVALRDAQ